MPRRARLVLPGVAIHAIQRGNNRSTCFFDNEDRALYLFHLGRLLPRAYCRLHAYCLMSNHVHLLLTAEQADGCGLLMKGIGQLYTQYINKRYGRCGSLWEGRFKSCLVQSEDYVLECHRYIELNPARAGMAPRADEYPWSSYRANAKGESCELLSAHEEYIRLGRSSGERQAVYRDGGYALGSASFKRAMARVPGRRAEPGDAGRPARHRPADQPDLLTAK